ncbi:MAG TPA: nucleotidyltransferase domain-containing protein [Treponemataceae bacterium]|jgi:predicted nucleotidyltransferase|nr:nucleotidyltransferase domain-containing protein [Treponemataceae bacterium]HQC27281.1 nucleotidyltransferase domain-containing protein [Treponemataceae bacterium]
MRDKEIDAIKDKLLEVIQPKKIFLFGSFAKQTQNVASDYDFYLTVPDSSIDLISLTQKAYKSLRGIRTRPVDIVINYEKTFVQRKEKQTLENIVAKEGILLYEQ